MKRMIQYPLVIVTILVMSGCGIYTNIYSDYDRSVDFGKYKTFAWLPDRDTNNSAYNNQVIRNNTRTYFTYEFAMRNYQVNIDSPDVFLELVITNVKMEKTYTNTVYTPSMGWYTCNPYYQMCPPAYYYPYPYNYNYSTMYVTGSVEYVEGGITLNMIDRKQNRLVWTCTAKGDLYDPDYIQENLHPAVYKILKRYPIQPVKVNRP